ncbi:hypothetical protein PspCFBP13509_08460 [Pseudomonas sp. CFBP13509]|uniref:hypothetical protein n=1 Tax=Pseudomonas sp. CFBP13509 TaxID=2184008 RepID=UPI0010C0D0AE|nr:hypothetical protein [Pseudomonas sp. CFBP13509]TKJ80257.1 hypothetical protein PspCFBP13509_08460 [Pseudomonas sp. CFBP13509]
MTISWGNWDVRVYAADAWVSLASRFGAEHPVIIDRLEEFLQDPEPSVRLQVAQNLQVIGVVAPERMWAMGQRIAAQETSAEIVGFYLQYSMDPFSVSEPERCEAVLSIIKNRLFVDLYLDEQENQHLQDTLGGWLAQLYVGQGRALSRTWFEEWVVEPERFGGLLSRFTFNLRAAFFERYKPENTTQICTICDRAQESLALILRQAITISAEAHGVLISDAGDADKEAAGKRFEAAEKVIHQGMNQLYFGSGAFENHGDEKPGLPNESAMARFLADYAEILALIANTRNPATLHHLMELYGFLIPGNPIAVFETIHEILLGRGKEEGYHYESLGGSVIVEIVQRYIADYRSIFEDEDQRNRLVGILQIFSEVGWPDALKLLYDLPDLLR